MRLFESLEMVSSILWKWCAEEAFQPENHAHLDLFLALTQASSAEELPAYIQVPNCEAAEGVVN